MSKGSKNVTEQYFGCGELGSMQCHCLGKDAGGLNNGCRNCGNWAQSHGGVAQLCDTASTRVGGERWNQYPLCSCCKAEQVRLEGVVNLRGPRPCCERIAATMGTQQQMLMLGNEGGGGGEKDSRAAASSGATTVGAVRKEAHVKPDHFMEDRVDDVRAKVFALQLEVDAMKRSGRWSRYDGHEKVGLAAAKTAAEESTALAVDRMQKEVDELKERAKEMVKMRGDVRVLKVGSAKVKEATSHLVAAVISLAEVVKKILLHPEAALNDWVGCDAETGVEESLATSLENVTNLMEVTLTTLGDVGEFGPAKETTSNGEAGQ